MTPAISLPDFAAKVLRRPLWPHQTEAADEDAFIQVIAGGRRSGKTGFSQAKAIYTAATARNTRVLVISPAVEGTRNWIRDLTELLRDSALADSVIDEQAQLVRFSNGSEIRCVAATSAQIRGRGRNLRLAIVDEAAFVPSSVWRDLYYTLFDLRSQGSQALLVCSPWGNAEHFFRSSYERGLAGEEGYAAYRWTMLQNPTLDAKFIERERERIAPSEAAAEIDGKWSDAAGALFTRELLERASAPVDLPELAALAGPAQGVIGVDWGVSYDRSATVGIFRLPINALNPDVPPTPRFIALPTVWKQGEPLDNVVNQLVGSLRGFRFIAPEINGVGSYPATELVRRAKERRIPGKRTWTMVSTTGATKTTGYAALLGLLETGKLILPRDPALLRQLAGIRFEQRERGLMRIGSDDDATHDDVADAMYLATLPHKPPRAHRVVCHLSLLASPQKAPPDARAPTVACALVETGSGLRLPVRPTLQSVAGVDFSLYAPPENTRQGFTAGGLFIRTQQPQKEIFTDAPFSHS